MHCFDERLALARIIYERFCCNRATSARSATRVTCEKGTIRSSGFEVPETSNFGYRAVVRLPSLDNSTLNIPNASPPSCISHASRISHLASRIPHP
jgi:hypothetical protein